MARAKHWVAMALAAAGFATLAGPVAAQRTSEGYQFLKAVRDRDGTEATDMLNQPGSTLANARDISTGETALHIVTQRRDAVWIRFLTSKGANPNTADKKGVTPLQLAVQLGYVDGAEALLESGASIDFTNNTGETPLITAIHRRDNAMVRLLVGKGANPDRSDNSGRTARDYAKMAGGNLLSELERSETDRKPQAQTYGPGA